jgi:hypothetical protein
MTLRIPLVSGFLSLTILCSCTWQEQIRYEFPVFSDDGEASAAVLTSFEARKAFANDEEREHLVQVLLAEETETESSSTLGDALNGRLIDYPDPQFFFMRSEGYIVLGRQGPDDEHSDGNMENQIWFDQVSLDGTLTPLGEGVFVTHIECNGGGSGDTLNPLRFIPSPDGTVLAKFEAETSCLERSLQLSLLDASTQSVLAGPYVVPDPSTDDRYAEVDMGWTIDSAFAVGFSTDGGGSESYEAVLYRVDAEPETGVSMSNDCFSPPTTSSPTNAEGDTLAIDEETGEIFIEPEEWGRVFGCED